MTGICADKAASRTNHGRHLGAQQSTRYLVPRSRDPAHHSFHDFSLHLSANHAQYLGRRSPLHVACSTRRDIIHMSNTQTREQRLAQLQPFDPITSWGLDSMPEGAGRRPGRQGGLNRSGTHRPGAHDAVAWAVAENGEQRKAIGMCRGSPSSSDTHGRADGPISDSSGCDHVKAPACALRSALCYR